MRCSRSATTVVAVVCAVALQQQCAEGFAFSGGLLQAPLRSQSHLSAASAHSEGHHSTHATATAAAADTGEPLKLGVLLCNLGGPERTEDVEPFLYNLFNDKDIIRLPGLLSPLQSPIASLLSKRRAPKSRAAYASIGGGSPIVRWTNAQASAIEANLSERGLAGSKCYVAMRYWHPYTSEALAEMRADGINAAVVLPLYPQFSISTSGSSLRALQEELSKMDPEFTDSLTHTVIPSWHNRPGYINSVARLCAQEVRALPPSARAAGATVLYSAHGVPQSYIAAGDPYQKQIQECTALITQRTQELIAEDINPETGAAYAADSTVFELSYQSRVGPVEWLRPYTDDKIVDLGAAGHRSLVVVPISFVSEHIETLEEIDIEYRELAEHNGIEHWRRVPALNTDAGFIEDLSDMVVEALAAPALTVQEAFLTNNCDRDSSDNSSSARTAASRRSLRVREKLSSRKPASPRSGSSSGTGSSSAGSTAQRALGKVAEHVATLGCLAFMIDGCGREILMNAQLPIINNLTF